MRNLRWTACVIVSLGIALSSHAVEERRERLVESVDLYVPFAPTVVRIADRRRIVYEVHITNFARVTAKLGGIAVLDAKRGIDLVQYRDAELTTKLAPPGRRWDAQQAETLEPGERVILYLWFSLPDEMPLPSRIAHRLDLQLMHDRGAEQVVLNGAEMLVRADAAVTLGPPLRGGPWVALYDPAMMGGHRTAIYTLDGRARIPARFATDWVRLGEGGSIASGDQARVANWHGYGADVLAVADGTITAAKDDMPSPERLDESQGPMALEAASGNYVTLQIAEGRYVFYEHLKSGSVRVKRGDHVKKGEVIAQLGNSGSSSSGPHLHFHVADADSTLAAEGLPYVFDTFEVIGAFAQIGDFAQGKGWGTVQASEGGRRTNELPGPNVVVRFR